MKTIINLLGVLALTLSPAFALDPVAEGQTNHELGAYIVENSNAPLIIDATILTTYEVSYENSDMTVRIAIDDSDKKCRKFIVVSDNLAIQYDCNGKFFGVKMPEQTYIEDGISGSMINLDRAEYHKQKVLTQNKKSELEQVQLIAVFFPKLIKDYDRIFAVK